MSEQELYQNPTDARHRPLDVAVVIRGGFLSNTAGSDASVGMIRQHRLMVGRFHDRRTSFVTLTDYDASSEDAVARMMMWGQPRRIVLVGHSWGCGRGMVSDCRVLRKHGRTVDLAVLYDPVPYIRGIGRHGGFLGGAPIRLPKNVRRAAVYRTVTRDVFWRPWGRDVEVKGSGRVIERRYFGRVTDIEKHRPFPIGAHLRGRARMEGIEVDGYLWHETPSPSVYHHTIDNLPSLHERTMHLIEQLLAGDLP